MNDDFQPIAAYYDSIMSHVNYARWGMITEKLGRMYPQPLRHLDAGCGTGTLMEQLMNPNWQAVGIDLSPSMLAVAQQRKLKALAVADFCALPFSNQFHLITCLFDSLNFLLEKEQVVQAMTSFYHALQPNGMLYFDIVTQRMIVNHFNNETWEKEHASFRSFWRSTYKRNKKLCETQVRINSGAVSTTKERIYSVDFLVDAIEQSGLTPLFVKDAYNWEKPGHRTTRIDFVALKSKDPAVIESFKQVETLIGPLG
ncbi:MAG: class I SAM-dependent methyltransferase [Candidatus Hydrogenedentes bacterium]|nr:class I SAM-dependent methyltransferase [Candidatus Hydrogenedentota bacterium]